MGCKNQHRYIIVPQTLTFSSNETGMSKVHSCCDDGVIKLDAHWSKKEDGKGKREEGRGKREEGNR